MKEIKLHSGQYGANLLIQMEIPTDQDDYNSSSAESKDYATST
jgi:hypothetical protein